MTRNRRGEGVESRQATEIEGWRRWKQSSGEGRRDKKCVCMCVCAWQHSGKTCAVTQKSHYCWFNAQPGISLSHTYTHTNTHTQTIFFKTSQERLNMNFTRPNVQKNLGICIFFQLCYYGIEYICVTSGMNRSRLFMLN